MIITIKYRFYIFLKKNSIVSFNSVQFGLELEWLYGIRVANVKT